MQDRVVAGATLARPFGAPVAVELADDGAGFEGVGRGGGGVPVASWVCVAGRRGGGEMKGGEAGGEDEFGDVGVAGDGGVDGVEGGEDGDGWGGEEGGVCAGEGVVGLAAVVGCVVVSLVAVLSVCEKGPGGELWFVLVGRGGVG